MLILHTSDIHGKLNFLKAKKILKFKEKGAVLLDSGDALSSGNFDIRWHEKTLFLMSKIGYTAGAIGNREFHPLPIFFKWKLRDSSFYHLSANLVSRSEIEKVRPYTDFEYEKYKVVVIGLTLQIVKGFWRKLLPLNFFEPISYGIKLAEELKEKYDFIIFLTHIGLNRDVKLAEKLKIPCLILGGHSHIRMEGPLKVNNSYIIHSGCHAKSVSLIEIKKEVKMWIEKL